MALQSKKLGKVLVLGARGMVGSAIVRGLTNHPEVDEVVAAGRAEVNLIDQAATYTYLEKHRPDWVIVAAARVGGIYANNTFPKDFIAENLAIELNAIEGSFRAGVEKIIFLGSSCIYPKLAAQPIVEESLLSGVLEPTNEPYAIAKIAGIKLCEAFNRQHGTDYRSLMPTNLYGPGDNYHPENSHVIPGLIYRFHNAKQRELPEVKIWGTGTPKREFLHVDDLAKAVIHICGVDKELFESVLGVTSHVNVGSGEELTIAALAQAISRVVGYKGELAFDSDKPDGTPRKLLDLDRLNRLSWSSDISIDIGLETTYTDFLTTHQ